MAHYSIEEMKIVLQEYPQYKNKLFCRGFLITDNNNIDITSYPFYGNWNKLQYGEFSIFTHSQQHIFYIQNDEFWIFLIGNAVNPFDMEYLEQNILKKLASEIVVNEKLNIDYINQLTGDFFIGLITKGKLQFLTDPSEMLFAAYGKIDNHMYISSHTQLIGDICNLKRSKYAEDLENYRFFYKYGRFFPGDLTQYGEVRRVLSNHIFEYVDSKFCFHRIYPTHDIVECKTKEEYQDLLVEVSTILKNTMVCASKKWDTPAVSLTGGMDSKTTLAMCNGIYDKFHYYSYITMDGDKIDADAAHKIANSLGIKHDVYRVSINDSDFENVEIVRKILEHNNGGYKVNANDVRKRIYFDDANKFDVEIKSWISEIGRANYYKKFGLKKMPKHLSPRNMTAMYKVFLTERRLAKRTDIIFGEFIKKSGFDKFPNGYDASDMYLWEFRYSAWGGMVITMEHSFSNEIFIPFNNRKLLDLMLRAPKEKRISDEFHEDLIRYGNSIISETGITITNWNETKNRMRIERFYFLLSSFFKNI